MTNRLAHALARPNEAPPADPHIGCPANARSATLLLLASVSGRAYRPAVPQTFCDEPLPAVGRAFSHMHWHTDRIFTVTVP